MTFGEQDNGSGGDSNYNSKNLQDSECTADSRAGNAYDGEDSRDGGGDFAGIGAELRNIGQCLTGHITPVLSGMFNAIQVKAAAIANEITQMEQDGERDAAARKIVNNKSNGQDYEEVEEDGDVEDANTGMVGTASIDSQQGGDLPLPWEIRQESTSPTPPARRGKTEQRPRNAGVVMPSEDGVPVYVTDNEIMEAILQLSRQESTFLEPFTDSNAHGGGLLSGPRTTRLKNNVATSVQPEAFVLDKARINLIDRLLDIDTNLATMHMRLSSESDEAKNTLFWKNYFYHCEKIRVQRRQQPAPNKEIRCSLATLTTAATKPTAINTKESVDSLSSRSLLLIPKQASDVVIEMITERPSSGALDQAIGSPAEDDDDDGSLVPAESVGEADDSSYVMASAPNSLNTFATIKSFGDDIVMVNTLDIPGYNKSESAN